MSGVQRPDAPHPDLPLWSSPLFVSNHELEVLYDRFVDECGLKNFSDEHFLVFVTYTTRIEQIKIASVPNELTLEQKAAINVAELCPVSR